MTEHLLHGRLVNAEGELLAEGPCWLDEAAGQATLEPERAAGVIQKERGRLSLQLDSGRSLAVSDRPIIISMQGQNGNKNHRRRLFRLRLLESVAGHNIAQDAGAVGAVGEGSPASQDAGPRAIGETPAAR